MTVLVDVIERCVLISLLTAPSRVKLYSVFSCLTGSQDPKSFKVALNLSQAFGIHKGLLEVTEQYPGRRSSIHTPRKAEISLYR